MRGKGIQTVSDERSTQDNINIIFEQWDRIASQNVAMLAGMGF